jgi:soluble lytic murein transglycosylase-like protein
MRWIIRTLAVLSVVSWMVVAGLFARPVVSIPPGGLPARQPSTVITRDLPADWSRHLLDVGRDAFPGVGRVQAERVVPIVERYAHRYGVDPLVVLAVIQVESRFDPTAVSSQGAMGLMQLQGNTARELAMDLGLQWTGDDLLFDPDVNVLLGCAYLSRLIDRFGDLDAALAAYSSGPGLIEARRDANGRIPLAYTDRVWDVLMSLQAKASA